MWFRKRESDIEMSGMMDPSQQKQKKKRDNGPPEETEYVRFDWKRFFFAPKYIRKPKPPSPCRNLAHLLTRTQHGIYSSSLLVS